MHKETRDVLILGALILGWGVVLWMLDRADHADWVSAFKRDPKALFAADTAEDRIAEELTDAAD